jgi:aminoglycoside phosphotransferase family enzyme
MSNTNLTKHRCEEEFEANQRGNQNPYIEEEQITHWPKEKVQRTNNDLQNIHIKLKID